MNGIQRAGEFQIKDVSPANREITGIITTDAVDRYGEVVDPRGALLESYRKNPVVLLNHITWGLPVGKNLWIKPEGNGLLAKTVFADTGEGRDTFKLYDEGFMKAWSIGFLPKEWEDGKGGSGYRRKFTAWELLEYSAVTVPANPEAVTNALKMVESPRVREMLGAKCELMKDERIRALSSEVEELRRTVLAMDARFERFLIVDQDPESDDEPCNHIQPAARGIDAQPPGSEDGATPAGGEEEERGSDDAGSQVETPAPKRAVYSAEQIDRQVAEALARKGVRINNS